MTPQSERVLGGEQPAEAPLTPGVPRPVGGAAAVAEPGVAEPASRAPSLPSHDGLLGAASSRGVWSPAARLSLHFGLVLLAASSGAALLGGARSGVSAALGVVLAGANLLLMRKITSVLVEASGAGAAWALALPVKLITLVGLAYALVTSGVARPVPLAMGFALLPLTGVFLRRASSVPDLESALRQRRAAGASSSRPGPSPTH
jgi:hypothetical protein